MTGETLRFVAAMARWLVADTAQFRLLLIMATWNLLKCTYGYLRCVRIFRATRPVLQMRQVEIVKKPSLVVEASRFWISRSYFWRLFGVRKGVCLLIGNLRASYGNSSNNGNFPGAVWQLYLS